MADLTAEEMRKLCDRRTASFKVGGPFGIDSEGINSLVADGKQFFAEASPLFEAAKAHGFHIEGTYDGKPLIADITIHQ